MSQTHTSLHTHRVTHHAHWTTMFVNGFTWFESPILNTLTVWAIPLTLLIMACLAVLSMIQEKKTFRLSAHVASIGPNRAFRILTEPKNGPVLTSACMALRKVSPGSMAVGSKLRETRKMADGSSHTADLLVTAFDPPNTYAISSSANGITVEYVYSFSPEKGGTRIDCACSVEADSVGKRTLVPLVFKAVKSEDSGHLDEIVSNMPTIKKKKK